MSPSPDPLTEAQKAVYEAVRAKVEAQTRLIEKACHRAILLGYGVTVYQEPFSVSVDAAVPHGMIHYYPVPPLDL